MKKLLLVISCLVLFHGIQAQNWWKNGMTGEGPIVTKNLDLEKFDAVGLQISGDLYLKQGNTQSVRIEGQQNILDNIKTEVTDGYWKIKFDKPVRKHDKLKVYITLPNLTAARVSGAGDIIGENKFTGLGDLALSISGSGNVKFAAEAASIELRISGSGDMEIDGSAATLQLGISGSGDIDAYSLTAKKCNVRISGSGDCKINVTDNLEAKISGSGDIQYKGRPRITSKISGSGGIVSRS